MENVCSDSVSEMVTENLLVNIEQKPPIFLLKYPGLAIPNLSVHGQALPGGGMNSSL